MYIIRQFLSEIECLGILDNLKEWKTGYTNASKSHKNNNELMDEKLVELIIQRIKTHPMAGDLLFIKRMTLPRFNRYIKGQHYSRHIDAFKQEGIQTDWSYTLCLQPAKQGGILHIETDGERQSANLNVGDIVFYPSGNIHEVTPVIEGERISVIGWLESLITSTEQRKILSNLILVTRSIDGNIEQTDNVLRLSYSFHNLMRMWSK